MKLVLRNCVVSVLLAAGLAGCTQNDDRRAGTSRAIAVYYPGLELGLTVGEARSRFPDLIFRPYYGFTTDTPSNDGTFRRVGLRVGQSIGPDQPVESDRVRTIDLFGDSAAAALSVVAHLRRALGSKPRHGCGGQEYSILVWHWSVNGESITVVQNSQAADGGELVVMVLSAPAQPPTAVVNNYKPEPCTRNLGTVR
jgi:hypothetical protein